MRTLIGLLLLLCALPVHAQVYRLKEHVVHRDSTIAGRVWYTVLNSEGTPTTNGRIYARSLTDFLKDYKLAIDTVPPVIEPPTPPADTAKPVPADTAYPNRPAGMTLIGRNVGTVKDAGGSAFGITGFGNWYDHNVASDIAVVNDPTNPTGSGQSLRFTYPSNDSKAGSATAGRFGACPCREIYVRMRIYHESGFADFGNKFFYVGAQSGQRHTSSPTQFYTDRNGSRLRIVVQNGTNFVAVQADNAITLGKWQTLEFHMVAESAVGAGNGRARMWIDGRQVASSDAVRWNATAFDGMEWYGEVNRIPTTSYYRLGELEIAGIR